MMNVILKQKLKELKERQGGIKQQFVMLDTKISMTSDHINYTKGKSRTSLKALEKKMNENQKEIIGLEEQVTILQGKVKEYEDEIYPKHEQLIKDKNELSNIKWKMNEKSSKAEEEIKFFQENDDCPTCEQHIDEEFKEKAIENRQDKMMINACGMVRLDEQLTEMEARKGLYYEIQSDARKQEVDAAKKKSSSNSLQAFNRDLYLQIEDIRNIDAELIEDKTKLKVYEEEMKIVEKEKNRVTDDQNYSVLAKQLLQDSGIKTKIIKKYLPIMNKLINSYLSSMDFHIQFELDETFNETLKSRYRDEFSYSNFSEGEKMRIDLALLFTWRQIAKMKNSTNTNLLVLDEIFDSSLDANGTDEFLKILSTISHENIFIISHKSDLNIDKFDDLIRFEKIQNFSRLTT